MHKSTSSCFYPANTERFAQRKDHCTIWCCQRLRHSPTTLPAAGSQQHSTSELGGRQYWSCFCILALQFSSAIHHPDKCPEDDYPSGTHWMSTDSPPWLWCTGYTPDTSGYWTWIAVFSKGQEKKQSKTPCPGFSWDRADFLLAWCYVLASEQCQ